MDFFQLVSMDSKLPTEALLAIAKEQCSSSFDLPSTSSRPAHVLPELDWNGVEKCLAQPCTDATGACLYDAAALQLWRWLLRGQYLVLRSKLPRALSRASDPLATALWVMARLASPEVMVQLPPPESSTSQAPAAPTTAPAPASPAPSNNPVAVAAATAVTPAPAPAAAEADAGGEGEDEEEEGDEAGDESSAEPGAGAAAASAAALTPVKRQSTARRRFQRKQKKLREKQHAKRMAHPNASPAPAPAPGAADSSSGDSSSIETSIKASADRNEVRKEPAARGQVLQVLVVDAVHGLLNAAANGNGNGNGNGAHRPSPAKPKHKANAAPASASTSAAPEAAASAPSTPALQVSSAHHALALRVGGALAIECWIRVMRVYALPFATPQTVMYARALLVLRASLALPSPSRFDATVGMSGLIDRFRALCGGWWRALALALALRSCEGDERSGA